MLDTVHDCQAESDGASTPAIIGWKAIGEMCHEQYTDIQLVDTGVRRTFRIMRYDLP